MSTELITGIGMESAGPVVQGVVHDLESFFWILCWIVTKYQGPATDDPKFTAYGMFDSSDRATMVTVKRTIIMNETHRPKHLLDLINPFFEPLKATVYRLADILKESYKTENFVGLHESFLLELKNAEDICRQSQVPVAIPRVPGRDLAPPLYMLVADLVQSELTRRQKDLLPPVFKTEHQKAEGGPSGSRSKRQRKGQD